MNELSVKLLKHEHGIYEDYEFLKNEKLFFSYSFNNKMNTARIQTSHTRRLFIIENEGLRKNRTVISNEYGFKIGEIICEKLHENEGHIFVDDERFNFSLPAKNNDALLIYKSSPANPLLSCNFPTYEEASIYNLRTHHTMLHNKYAGLLMALCWCFVKSEEEIFAFA